MTPKVFIIARMGSSRLPGKVLMPLADRTVLGVLVERMRQIPNSPDIVLTTSTDTRDDPIAAFGAEQGLEVFRGSESDTVERVYMAAKQNGADPVVRVTGDCPMLEAKTVASIIERITSTDADYVSTDLTPTYPNGMGCDALRFPALERVYELSKTLEVDKAWEHLCSPQLDFRVDTIAGPENASQYRFTVDTAEDMELIRKIVGELFPQARDFGLDDILELIGRNPDWLKINAHVVQKTGPHSQKR